MLHPQRAIFWEETRTLLLADLHLGKAGHFRKAGIPIPGLVHNDDLLRLRNLVEHFAPANILILGDLFHSDHNLEWDQFVAFVGAVPSAKVALVTGNHDIMELHRYGDLIKYDHAFVRPPFIFSHKPLAMPELPTHKAAHTTTYPRDTHAPADEKQKSASDLYNICGHMHPAIRVPVGLRHSIKAPCFYFGQKHAVLPAFGLFTGTHTIKPEGRAHVCAIIEDRIVPVKT